MDWWTDVVFRITGPNAEHRGQGTGFACACTGDAVFVVTCWHVVREIERTNLHINYHRSCRVVSEPGGDELDLAVLRVPGPSCGNPLTLASCGTSGMAFETYGYGPIGRPLSGTLGAKTGRPYPPQDDLLAWDYYLDEGSRALEKIEKGYSGAPVFDPKGHRVVAVITHGAGTDKGFAIDIANLPRVYSPAEDWLVASETIRPEADNAADVQAESDGEYAATDDPLVKILDHTDQLVPIRDLLKDGTNDRAIALVEACSKDWPSYLADHVHLDPWPGGYGHPPEAITLRLKRFDEQAFWEALLEVVPGVPEVPHETARQAIVRGWINSADLRVLYFSVGLERHGRHLPKIIRGIQASLDGLGDFAPGTRVLVIIACLRNKAGKVPFWWPWYVRFKLAGLECCRRLAAMRLLDTTDIEDWYAGFPHSRRACYDLDPLKARLLALFEPGHAGIRYERVRRCLIDEGALQLARRNP
ncbi:S1 family peptidase [Candidatus Thiosymbion oneisti]|uniref:S1 family peptidase n=1 Tax=Candidatus Thiosymbion oneisti TaxID=589554 RepID=UPI0010612CE1|nr:serine protease [Candidatus Thiosymbion oneisti]